MFRFNPSQFLVKLGGYDLDQNEIGESVTYKVSEIRVPGAFTGSGLPNDIALFKLRGLVSYNDFIQPVCLPWRVLSTFSDEMATIVGWGASFSGNQRASFYTKKKGNGNKLVD